MLKWKIEVPEAYRENFFHNIYLESITRVRAVLFILMLLQGVQMTLYILGSKSPLHDVRLIVVKLSIVLFCILSYCVLYWVQKDQKRFQKYNELILCTVISVVLSWSVINTFIAQSITSDISIYILVLFAISAVVRLRPWVMIVILGANYLLFFIGLPHYQSNPEYLTSHIMNGLILNIVALMVARMMYQYSLNDFSVRQDIGMKNGELFYLAKHDGLTALYNHQAIHEMLEAAIVQAKATAKPLSVMLIDLDYFKEINDILGHQAGDNALKKVTACIKRNIRHYDIAGRYGGDEFLIVLPGSTIKEAEEIAERVLHEIREIDFDGLGLSFSCGIAGWHGQKAELLIDEADKALYCVKHNGRNNIYAKKG